MPLADYEELDTTSLKITDAPWSGAVIRKSFGGGNKRKILVGPSYGSYKWKITTDKHIPGNGYGILINGLSRMDYYLDFFQRFTVGDDDVFVIEFRSKKWTVGFVDVSFPFTKERLMDELFTTDGIEIEFRFVPGETDYLSDGSLFVPEGDPFAVIDSGGHSIIDSEGRAIIVYIVSGGGDGGGDGPMLLDSHGSNVLDSLGRSIIFA